MNKPLVIYHANCADGFGAAFAAWLKLGDEAEYLPMQYGKDYSKSENTFDIVGREIYILDFSFPREVMEMLFTNAKRVVWLDHHKTAFEMWCPTERTLCEESFGDKAQNTVILDNNRSGALIAWEYFHPDTEVPMMIKHIDDYDRWQFQLKGTKEINKALWSYAPWSFDQWQEMTNDVHYGSMFTEGSALLRDHDQKVKSVVEKSRRPCMIQARTSGMVLTADYHGLAANCPGFVTSDVGHELAVLSGTYGLCWTLNQAKMTANCSLRSNGDYDVSAIAKAFGGGGHKNAAGFEVPIATLLGWMS